MTWSGRAATGSAATFQNNIWCYLINKTFKQLNAERAGWRAHLKRRSRVFKENQKRLKTTSSQAGGPAHKEPGQSYEVKMTAKDGAILTGRKL